MDTRGSKSNPKRQREQGNRPCALRKSQRLLDKNKSADEQNEPDEPMKITGLNDDCLQKIFEPLDLRSLFNVAVSNEWLRPAANIVYKRKFGMKKVNISNNRYNAPFECSPHQIAFTGLKLSLQFLRCLGSSINDLNIFYQDWNGKQCEYIHQYVNKYCAETLVEIKFWFKPASIPIGPFEKPFANVRAVEVHSSVLSNELPLFAEWFPNMRSLKLRGATTSPHIGALKFDHLEELSIYVSNGGDNFTINEATRLLQQLPHLHSLDIWGSGWSGFTLDTLLNVIKHNRAIFNLKVDMFQYSMTAVFNVQQLINEHPLLIELELMGLQLTLDTIIPLISQLNALKRLRFQIVNRSEYDRLVARLDNEWHSSFSDNEPPNYKRCFVQLER